MQAFPAGSAEAQQVAELVKRQEEVYQLDQGSFWKREHTPGDTTWVYQHQPAETLQRYKDHHLDNPQVLDALIKKDQRFVNSFLGMGSSAGAAGAYLVSRIGGASEETSQNLAIGVGLGTNLIGSGVASRIGAGIALENSPLNKVNPNTRGPINTKLELSNNQYAENLHFWKIDKWDRVPRGIQDLITLDAAKYGAGEAIIRNLNDPKYKGFHKYEYKTKSDEGLDSVVHYVRFPNTDYYTDFKFKKQSVDSISNEDKVKPYPRKRK